MRIVVLTIEFCFGTFSGNGVYAMSQVRALRRLGHDIMVICGCPKDALGGSLLKYDEFRVEAVPLPSHLWGRLDVGCGWREFATGCGSGEVLLRVQNFLGSADVVLGIDWHSYVAYQRLAKSMEAVDMHTPPYATSNYRMFSRSAQSEKEAGIIRELEGDSLRMGICCTVLSRSDELFAKETYFDAISPGRLHVLLPALRADIAAISPPHDSYKRRQFLLCCVRASPEKEPHRFVDLIIELGRRKVFHALGISPLIVGAGWNVGHRMDADEADLNSLELYAVSLRRRLLNEIACCKIVDSFLSAEEMASIYAQTILNVHPCLTDAYGMTVVEAASQGAPSLVNCGQTVGCTDLLKPECGQIIETDMSRECLVLADFVEKLLTDRQYLANVGLTAMSAARKWDEDANARCLANYLKEAIEMQHVQAPHKCIALQPVQQRNGIDVWHVHSLPYTLFVEKYLTARKPVLISGITRDWRASYDWVTETMCLDLQKMEQIFKEAVVPITDVLHSDKDNSFPCTEMKFSEYCSWFSTFLKKKKKKDPLRQSGPLYYLKDWHMTAQFPDYQAYDCPIYFRDDWLNEWFDSLCHQRRESKSSTYAAANGNGCTQTNADYRFCYMGPSMSRTMLHADVLHSHSWSANIVGRKVWQLLPPSASHLVYDEHQTYHSHTLQSTELSAKDQKRFFRLDEANSYVIEIEQEAGEVLFVPSGWLHQVTNVEDCVSINHNFISSCSVADCWSYMQREYKHAAKLIEDCRSLTSAEEFELLVQRNLQANAGSDYEDLGKMLRFIAFGAIDRLSRRDSVEHSSEGSYPSWLTVEDALCRLKAATPVLEELVSHARSILANSPGNDKSNSSSLETEFVANQNCLNAAASLMKNALFDFPVQ